MGYLEFCSNCGTKNKHGRIDGVTRYHCLKCQTIHYENPKPTSTLICPHNETILLVKRGKSPGKGLWGLPGGFIERGETPEEGGRRELKEETNLAGDIERYIGNCSHYNTMWGDILLLGFIMKVKDINPLYPGDDAQEAKFFSIPAMPKLAFRCHEIFIKRYFNSIDEKQTK